jgi:RHS repeat-associated protein
MYRLSGMTTSAGATVVSGVSYNPANNQMDGIYETSYDANGNVLGNTGIAAYDSENRISTVNNGTLSGLQYGYDAQNRRTFLWPGTFDTFYPTNEGNPTAYSVVMYSPTGQKLGIYQINTYNSSVNNIVLSMCSTLMSSDQYFGARRVAAIDQLGSAGTYYPWGENKGSTNPQNTWGFGTYWQDSATGLDYASNRYYSNAYGRFMTPDPYTNNGRLTDPQSWNRYAYTRGDPVNRFDPGGTCDQSADGNYSVTVCDTADTVDTYSISGLGSYNQWVTAGVNDAVAIASIAAAAAVEQYQFSVALAAFQNAASQIEGTGSFSAQCDKDLAAVGASPAALQAAASTADFQNGIGSSATVASLYSGAATPIVGQLGANSPGTIGQVFAGSPLGVVAEAQLGGNNIYLNGPLISGLLNGTYQLTGGAAFNVTAVVMHELLHNLTGLTDPEIQTDLGLTQSAVTDNISQKLATDCLK